MDSRTRTLEKPAPTGRAAALTVEGLTKRYGSLLAVDHVSFAVEEGEIFGLLGPNGAGKTTTLEMIEGLRRPDAGRAIVAGIDVTENPREVRRRVGIQLQEAGFFEKLTVAETLRTFAAFHQRTLPIPDLIASFNLTEKQHALVENLSGGQRQRLSIALTIMNDPRLVFLDEPTTGLDPQARRNLWDVILAMRNEGRTVVLTTHYMEEAQQLCDRVAIIDAGRIVALDTPLRLIAQHAPGSRIHLGRWHAADKTEADGEATSGTPARPEGPGWLRGLPGVDRVEISGDGYIVHSADAALTLPALFERSRANGGSFGQVSVQDGSLEDVFINLTGKRLRE